MEDQPHAAVRTLHDAARSVLQHGKPQPPRSFWARLTGPRPRSLYDKIHDFADVLSRLLDIPPTMLSAADLTAVGADVEQVVGCAERAIDSQDDSSDEPIDSFPAVIYTIRAQYEQIYQRGASKDA